MNADNYDEWEEDAPKSVPPPFSSGSGYRKGQNESGGNDGWEESNKSSNWQSNRGGNDTYDRRGRGRGGGGNRGGHGSSYSSGDSGAWEGNSSSRESGGWEGSQTRGGGGRSKWEDSGSSGGGWNERRSGNGGGDRWEENDKGGWKDNRFSDDCNGRDSSDRRGRGGFGRGRGRGFPRDDDDFDKGSGDGFRGRGRRIFDDEENNMRRGRGGDSEHPDLDEKPRERYIPPDPTDDENVMFGNTISSGINFDKYDSIQVQVTGENVPKSISTFQDCQLRNLIMDNIRKSKYPRPTPVQKHALPIILEGRDLMACAQTGSGKTAAFLLPIIHILLSNLPDAPSGRPVKPQVIICSPTRELAVQIFNEARKFSHGSSLKICIAYGGTVFAHQANSVSKGCHMLIGTPGRLNDFVNKNVVQFSSVQFFVLDEADRMLDLGFLPAIEQMLQHETMPPIGERQTLMFSATFPEDIQHLASKHLNNYLFLAVGVVGGACSDVVQEFHEVSKFDKRQKLIDVLSAVVANENELTLVFVEKKRTADFIAAFLSENAFPTTSIHGDRLQSQREEALRDFKCGRRPILVATAVAARGLDIKNVAHVVNFDLPNSIEEYVHRIGRTGRVGNSGKATSFYEPSDDANLAPHLVRILEQTGQKIPSFLENTAGFSSNPHGYSFNDKQSFGGRDVRGASSFSRSEGGVQPIEEEEMWG